MTQFFLHLFFKELENGSDSVQRAVVGRKAGILGIICNCALALTKMLAGFVSGSVAIIADAVNNLSDAVSSIVTFIGFQLSQRPADQDHPFGHARYEYLAGLVVAELILVVGYELGKTSFKKILYPSPIPFNTAACIFLILSIAVKLWMSKFFHYLSVQIQSSTLEAASADSRNDVLATTVVLLSYVTSIFLPFQLDGYAGLAVAAFILYSGLKIIRETISPLLGGQADRQLVHKLTEMVSSHDKILGVHDLLIHDYGPGNCFASLHAEMDGENDPFVNHDLLDHIENEALSEMNIHLVIHCDPVLPNNPKWDALRSQVETIITSLNPNITIHDFRILEAETNPRLDFDLSIPFGFPDSNEEVLESIQALLHQAGIPYPSEIHIDRNM